MNPLQNVPPNVPVRTGSQSFDVLRRVNAFLTVARNNAGVAPVALQVPVLQQQAAAIPVVANLTHNVSAEEVRITVEMLTSIIQNGFDDIRAKTDQIQNFQRKSIKSGIINGIVALLSTLAAVFLLFAQHGKFKVACIVLSVIAAFLCSLIVINELKSLCGQ
jgi:hypothetical protein